MALPLISAPMLTHWPLSPSSQLQVIAQCINMEAWCPSSSWHIPVTEFTTWELSMGDA